MIKLLSSFSDDGRQDIHYIKIAASIEAYSLGRNFLSVWQTGDTLIFKQDDYLTLCGDDFDGEEVKKFISMLGVRGISCSTAAAEKLGFPYKEYNVLRSVCGFFAEADYSPKTDEVYRILSLGTDGDIVLPERTAFMADLSHRVRHGTALAAVYKETVAVAPYIAAGGALICGVSAGENRGQGFAGVAVAALVGKIGKPCFTVCSDALLGFYKKFGFIPFSKTAEIIFE